jgi:hypothetical protein
MVAQGARFNLKDGNMSVKSMTIRSVWVMIVVSLATINVLAQSGRSWMGGMVFGESDTQGLVGARVELIGDPGSSRLRDKKLTADTDKDGKYSLKDIPYGDYTFRVSADGFVTYEVKLYVASDTGTTLHVKLRRLG